MILEHLWESKRFHQPSWFWTSLKFTDAPIGNLLPMRKVLKVMFQFTSPFKMEFSRWEFIWDLVEIDFLSKASLSSMGDRTMASWIQSRHVSCWAFPELFAYHIYPALISYLSWCFFKIILIRAKTHIFNSKAIVLLQQLS
jgi:hypothetical protein